MPTLLPLAPASPEGSQTLVLPRVKQLHLTYRGVSETWLSRLHDTSVSVCLSDAFRSGNYTLW